MNNSLTLRELITDIEEVLKGIKSKITNQKELEEAYSEAIMKLPYELDDYHLVLDGDLDGDYISMSCSKMVHLLLLKATFQSDRRRAIGHNDYIEKVEIELLENDLPLDIYILDIEQQLEYNIAKNDFERLVIKQNELISQYKENCIKLQDLIKTMTIEAYDSKTKNETLKAMKLLEKLKINI